MGGLCCVVVFRSVVLSFCRFCCCCFGDASVINAECVGGERERWVGSCWMGATAKKKFVVGFVPPAVCPGARFEWVGGLFLFLLWVWFVFLGLFLCFAFFVG